MKIFRSPTPATPPDFDVVHLIHMAMDLSTARGVSPVRFMSMGGDVKRRRTGMRWSPSALRGCPRKSIYKAVGVRPYPGFKVSVKDQMVFDRGTVIGGWVAAYFRALEAEGAISDVECQCVDREEVLVTDESLNYGGFIDILFTYESRRYIVEVKSKDNDDALGKISKPSEDHLGQLNDYMALKSVYQGWVLYAGLIEAGGRQSLDFRSFPHAFDAQRWENSKNRISSLELLYAQPNRMPPGTSNKYFECPTCPYRLQCDALQSPAKAKELQDGSSPES